ncbi:hypothetical protein RhiJN_18834 [Ceratobasidium sp. AG-Ba]|nr:hypothetical protein RhiJN_18834 [Ceratobasidium sp. AG-Ba]
MAAPVPAPSFVITRTEEWPEADFDLADDQESFTIDNEGEPEADLADISARLKGSRPSLSGAGAVARLGGAPVEDEDWDAEFEDPPPKSSTSGTSSMSASLAKFAGKVTRLGSVRPETTRPVEDWSDDGDLELPEPSRTNLTLPPRAPLPQPDVPELEDTGDVSTIKVAKLNFPTVAKSATASKSATAPNEDDDFEADFALPEDMGNLSLKILTPQTSTLSLRHKSSTGVSEGHAFWNEMTTSSSAYSDTSSLLSMYPADASPSVTSSSQPGTETDPSDADFGIYDEEDETFDGLVLPEGLAGKALAKHLEIKKKVVPAKIAAAQDAKGAAAKSQKAPNEAEDFESGLLIGDDEDLSPSRLRTRRELIDTPRSKSVPVPRSASIVKPSSRLRTESVMEVLASASNYPSISRSRSPNSSSRGSLSRKDSRSSLVSPTGFSSLRPSSFRTTSSTLPHASSSTLNLLTIPGTPPVTSGIAPRAAPLKHQKSLGRLQLSTATTSGSGQRLPRKASLSSLADASAAAAAVSSSGTPSSSSTLSARSGFSAPTAASKARHKPDAREQAEAEKKRAYPVPPTRPTTPSTNPIALRLTMPTSSSRQKIRPAISSVFPSPATATSQSFADRAISPQPNNPRRTPTSPHRVRTRSGASTGATPSSSISSITSTVTSVKVLRKPKRAKTYGDGTELDAFDDLPEDTEKERQYRVQPVGRGPPRGDKGSATAATPAVASGGTIGRRSASGPGTLRRPPSSASSHGSAGSSKNPGMQSLRHKPRIDFPPKVSAPEPPARRRKPVVTPINGPRKKPMLIRNLGGAGAAKTVGDMKWNPKTLRWEGNEQVLKEFDAHLPSSRPALITHFTGSTLGGVTSPTGSFLASGARIVGNMMFDPVRMCWISRLPPEEDEPDVFAGLADDEGDEWEDKAGTIRANAGLTASTDDVQDWKGSVRSTNSDRAMTMSPTRSHTKSMSESGSEAGDPPPRVYDSRRSGCGRAAQAGDEGLERTEPGAKSVGEEFD